jgi:putative SOS response-associated peptidase YedK
MRKGDQQWYFQCQNPIFGLAGICAESPAPDEPPTFAVLTTEPNDVVGRVHSRMPVIVPDASIAEWLDPKTDVDSLGRQLVPRTPPGFKGHRVRMQYVNRPALHDGPECIEPHDGVEEKPIQGQLF